DDRRDAPSDHVPESRKPVGIRVPRLRQAVSPGLDYIHAAGKMVNAIRDTIEHAVDGAKGALVIQEYKSENQILDGGHTEESYIAAGAVGFINCPQQTKDEDDAGDLEHSSGNPLLVDAVQSGFE